MSGRTNPRPFAWEGNAAAKQAKTSTRKLKASPEALREAQAVLDGAARRMLREQIAETKQPKTTRRKQAGAKKPKMAAVTEPKVGDRKLVEAAVAAAAAAKTALVQRDEAIRAAVAGGTSARQVALAVGFSHPAVLKIVKR